MCQRCDEANSKDTFIQLATVTVNYSQKFAKAFQINLTSSQALCILQDVAQNVKMLTGMEIVFLNALLALISNRNGNGMLVTIFMVIFIDLCWCFFFFYRIDVKAPYSH